MPSEYVGSRACATYIADPLLFQHIDLNTVTVEELAFKVPFDLKAERSDCELLLSPVSRIEADSFLVDIHAFLGWFDCSFDACHKPVKFSTGPHAKYTHWKVGNFEPSTFHQTDWSNS